MNCAYRRYSLSAAHESQAIRRFRMHFRLARGRVFARIQVAAVGDAVLGCVPLRLARADHSFGADKLVEFLAGE